MADDTPDEHTLPAGARRDSGFFLLLFAVTIVLYFFSIPLVYGVLLTGPAAGFFAVRALIRSRSVPKITGYRVGLSAGIGVAGLAMLTGFAMIVFHGPVSELQNCSARAITQTAEDQCQRDYQDNIQALMEDTLERLSVSP